jgi:hypothetical protein
VATKIPMARAFVKPVAALPGSGDSAIVARRAA